MINELMMAYTPEVRGSVWKRNVIVFVITVIAHPQGANMGAGSMSVTAKDQAAQEKEWAY